MIFNIGGIAMKRKWLLFFCLLAIVLCSCEEDYSNYDVKINFTPSEYYNAEIRCVEKIIPFDKSNLIYNLKHAKRVGLLSVPKSEVAEGRYQILLYENGACVGDYEICDTDYLFDTKNDCYLKCKNILYYIQAIFYMQIMINNMDIPIEIPKN